MIWVKRGNGTLLRALVVALAVFGTAADALPVPFFTSTNIRDPEGEGPYSPSQEDERDETPDDASDLAWPVLRVIARSGRSDASSRLAKRLGLSTVAWEPVVGHDPLLARRATSPAVAAVALCITLCRLTC